MRMTDIEWMRFVSKIEVGDNGCWIWQGNKDKYGYGFVKLRGQRIFAHKAILQDCGRHYAPEQVTRHTCDNPSCVNPQHLIIGTQAENVRDMVERGRARGGAGIGNQNAVGNRGRAKGEIPRGEITDLLKSGIASVPWIAQCYGVSANVVYRMQKAIFRRN